MKVAFWSNGRGRACVTSNLACMSVLSILDNLEKRIIVFENHRNIFNLGSTLVRHDSNNQIREKYPYRIDRGLDKVLHILESNREITEEQIFCMAEDFLEKRLLYLPTDEKSAENFEYYLGKQAKPVLECFERSSDLVLVDTASSSLESSRKILHNVDFVVVNLTQNQFMLEHFFRNFSSIQKHAFYLIGNYDAGSQLTKERIQRKYHIQANQIGVIPHNADFLDAVSEGKVISFLSKNYSCAKGTNVDFMECVKEAVSLFHYWIDDCAKQEEWYK